MSFQRAVAVAFLAGLLGLSCAQQEVERGESIPATPSSVRGSSPRPRSTTTVSPLLVAREVSAVLTKMFPTTTTTRPTPSTTTPRNLVQYPASYQPCGGIDYPPCYRVGTESGGDYNAYNPTGCNGRGCYGKWQFSGEWACRLGLPCDLATATPQQQDEAARILWNRGAGCSNWSAC